MLGTWVRMEWTVDLAIHISRLRWLRIHEDDCVF